MTRSQCCDKSWPWSCNSTEKHSFSDKPFTLHFLSGSASSFLSGSASNNLKKSPNWLCLCRVDIRTSTYLAVDLVVPLFFWKELISSHLYQYQSFYDRTFLLMTTMHSQDLLSDISSNLVTESVETPNNAAAEAQTPGGSRLLSNTRRSLNLF